MKKLKDLIKTPEYWLEEIQNELFRQLHDYMERTGKAQSDIAKDLKVSESYISQILNGNFNYTLKKLIDLSLYIGKVPDFNFSSADSYLSKISETDQKEKSHIYIDPFIMSVNPASFSVGTEIKQYIKASSFGELLIKSNDLKRANVTIN